MRKGNKLFKFGAVLLCAVLIFCMMPMSAKAANYDSCTHHQTHDDKCGGTDDKCTYICEICKSNIEELLAALPAMNEIDTNDEVQVAAVGAQLSAIDAVRCGLSDAATMAIDFTKYSDAAFVLCTPPNFFGFCVQKTYEVANYEGSLPTPTFAFINEDGETATIALDQYGMSAATAIDVAPNGQRVYGYLPAGTYTLDEDVEGQWNLTMTVNGAEDDDLTFTGKAGEGYALELSNSRETIDISVIGVQIKDKIYDGNITAEFESYGTLQGNIIGSDDVYLDTTMAKAEFKDPEVGTDKDVSISGYELKGKDAKYYRLNVITATANILPAPGTNDGGEGTKDGEPDKDNAVDSGDDFNQLAMLAIMMFTVAAMTVVISAGRRRG